MSKGKGQKVPVTMRALVQRINRKLAPNGTVLKATRGTGQSENLGDYYVVHVHKNEVESHHVDAEVLGRRLKVLKPWEELVEDK